MAAVGEADRLEAVRHRLRTDYIFFAERAVKIVNKQGKTISFKLKRAQKRLMRALMAQRDAGEPQRAIACKARQIGISTAVQSMEIQRSTQEENHLGMVLAQDRDTAGALHEMGAFMWANLPKDIKPPAARQSGTKDRKHLLFGEPSAALRKAGVLGLNSQIEIATSRGLAARGRTPRTLHVSEYAWWTIGEAILGVINGVPDDPDSMVVKESTPNGHNHFKDEWDLAVAGEDGYYPFFSPWFEEEDYRRPFANVGDALEFKQSIGYHPRYGEDEPRLLELITSSYLEWHAAEAYPWLDLSGDFGAALELRVLQHLNWRRWAIASKCQGSVMKFKQEYPSDADEGFLSTGARVFDPHIVSAVIKRCEQTDPSVPTIATPGPVPGVLRVGETKQARDRTKQLIEIPTSALWVPGAKRAHDEVARWRLWSAPQKARDLDDGTRVPDGQYIVFCDPASGETDEKGTTHAEHAIEVIDHRTRKQVAEWVGQIDPDLVGLELLLIALYFNRAWVNVERTGGYGLSMLRKLKHDYRYPYVWTDESKDKRTDKRSDRLGWSTDSVSKPLMEGELIELLRLEKDGIQSLQLARQLLTIVRDDRGRSGPEAGKLSDRAMAYMGAQITAKVRPIRPDNAAPSGGKKPASKKRRRNPKTGY